MNLGVLTTLCAMPEQQGNGAAKKLFRNRWFIGAAAGIVGIAIGAGGAGEGTHTAVPQSATSVAPAPTVTATATATATATTTATATVMATETVTAEPQPAPTVTVTSVVTETAVNEPRGLVDSNAGKQENSRKGSSAYYKNCSEARAAGVTPLHRGDPGYSSKLDRDGDGVACE